MPETLTSGAFRIFDKGSKKVHDREMEVCIDCNDREPLEGPGPVDFALQYANTQGFHNATVSEIMPDIVPLDADTGEPMQEITPGKQAGGYRRYVKLVRFG